MRRTASLLVVLTALAGGVPAAEAATIGFSPSAATVAVGGSVSLDVVVSDLGADVLGDFDLDIVLSSSTSVALTGYSVAGALGDTLLFEAIDASLGDVGTHIDLAVVSLLTAGELAALQSADPFVLATLTFDALDVGTTILTITQAILGDGAGSALSATLNTGAITVIADNGNPVPEPASMLLLGSGALCALARERRRRRRNT